MQRGARHVQPQRADVHQVPARRNGELQVRVVGEDRLAGHGAAAGNRPGVRTGLQLAAQARREQSVHLGCVTFLEHVQFGDFVAPGCGEGAVHLQTGENRIAHTPWTRIVAEQRELERQPSAIRFEIEVDATRIGGEHGAIRGRHAPFGRLRDARQTQAARFFIELDRLLAGDLRQFAGCQPAQCVHLPHPVLRGRVALQENRVLPRSGIDVRHPQCIARDGRLGGNRRRDLTRSPRQRTPGEPIGR